VYKSSIGKQNVGLKINTYEILTKTQFETIHGANSLGNNQGAYKIVYDTTTNSDVNTAIKNAYTNGTSPDYIIDTYVSKIINDVRILDPTTTSLDAIRRMLLGYEMMIHIIIANYLFTRPIAGTDTTATNISKNVARNLLEICILNFVELNIQFVINVNNTSKTVNPTQCMIS
jgi:hypothetical protein